MKKIIFLIIALFLIACQPVEQVEEVTVPELTEEEKEVQEKVAKEGVTEDYQNTGGGVLAFKEKPSGDLKAGINYDFSWLASGGSYIKDTTVQASFSEDFSEIVAESNPSTNGPGTYKGTIKVSGGTTVYIRAHAMIDGAESVSETLAYTVTSDSGDSMAAEVQEVNLVAKNWRFEPATVTVKKGIPVKLVVKTSGNDHGIAIAEFGVNVNLPSGETTNVEFTPDKTGTFSMVCSVYCGSGHKGMVADLVVE